MSQETISGGVVHEVPADLKQALTSDPQALTAWVRYCTARTQRVDMLD
jgi:hypothetical protein